MPPLKPKPKTNQPNKQTKNQTHFWCFSYIGISGSICQELPEDTDFNGFPKAGQDILAFLFPEYFFSSTMPLLTLLINSGDLRGF